MPGKILIGLGSALLFVAGFIYLTQLNALHLAETTMQASVQQYARESADVGMNISRTIATIGASIILIGTALWGYLKFRHRVANPEQAATQLAEAAAQKD
jgi:hypothetical protein